MELDSILILRPEDKQRANGLWDRLLKVPVFPHIPSTWSEISWIRLTEQQHNSFIFFSKINFHRSAKRGGCHSCQSTSVGYGFVYIQNTFTAFTVYSLLWTKWDPTVLLWNNINCYNHKQHKVRFYWHVRLLKTPHITAFIVCRHGKYRKPKLWMGMCRLSIWYELINDQWWSMWNLAEESKPSTHPAGYTGSVKTFRSLHLGCTNQHSHSCIYEAFQAVGRKKRKEEVWHRPTLWGPVTDLHVWSNRAAAEENAPDSSQLKPGVLF